MKLTLFSIALLSSLAVSSQAAVVSVSSLHAHNNRDNFGGNLNDLITGEEMNKVDPNDPSTWQLTTSAFTASWQAEHRLDPSSSNNSKIGWAALNFGSVVSNLDQLYIWNLRDGSNTRAVATYNIYYASGAITSFPATPTASGTEVDYAFTAGNGWTLFNGSPLSLATPSGQDAEAVIALGGISAQYIAIEILTATGGDNLGSTNADRIGLNEVAVTQIPEPSFTLLSGLGLLMLLRRRRH